MAFLTSMRLCLTFIVTVKSPLVPMKPREDLKAVLDNTKDPIEIAMASLIERMDAEIDNTSGEQQQARNHEMSDEESRYALTVEDAKGRVADMKDYLLSIANTPFSEALPPPHLERHQTYLLCGGYTRTFKKLETMLLGMECFPFSVRDGILSLLHSLFKAKPKPKTGSRIPFVPLIPKTSPFASYDLPQHIPGHVSYVNNVLVYEAITKLVMDLEGCDYLTATGIALGEGKPSHTTYGMNWRSLIAEARRKSNTSSSSKRKQQRPGRVVRKK